MYREEEAQNTDIHNIIKLKQPALFLSQQDDRRQDTKNYITKQKHNKKKTYIQWQQLQTIS